VRLKFLIRAGLRVFALINLCIRGGGGTRNASCRVKLTSRDAMRGLCVIFRDSRRERRDARLPETGSSRDSSETLAIQAIDLHCDTPTRLERFKRFAMIHFASSRDSLLRATSSSRSKRLLPITLICFDLHLKPQ
jgi:hypothetical protein